ncbi:hypothetical protein CRUP_010323 [Coryphaenoides rupestris]|nr:hypothetical protein CRUP_010323 [Coryphaenoides rupestris]
MPFQCACSLQSHETPSTPSLNVTHRMQLISPSGAFVHFKLKTLFTIFSFSFACNCTRKRSVKCSLQYDWASNQVIFSSMRKRLESSSPIMLWPDLFTAMYIGLTMPSARSHARSTSVASILRCHEERGDVVVVHRLQATDSDQNTQNLLVSLVAVVVVVVVRAQERSFVNWLTSAHALKRGRTAARCPCWAARYSADSPSCVWELT